jgi:putative transposase
MLGRSADLRRAGEARPERLADEHPPAVRPREAAPGAAAVGAELARVPARPAASIVACDFFTVESIFLRRYYVLFFIGHASRRVWLAGCTTNPTGAWVTQQARNLGIDFADPDIRFLIRDRDSKYGGAFDEVVRSEQIRIVKTPVRAPKANAIAERFVRTARAECLDWPLIPQPDPPRTRTVRR